MMGSVMFYFFSNPENRLISIMHRSSALLVILGASGVGRSSHVWLIRSVVILLLD